MLTDLSFTVCNYIAIVIVFLLYKDIKKKKSFRMEQNRHIKSIYRSQRIGANFYKKTYLNSQLETTFATNNSKIDV